MKNLTLAIVLITTFITNSVFAQIKRTPASFGRAEYIEVEKNVKLHVTDLGEGEPIVLIHGWPLSDAITNINMPILFKKGIG